MSERHLQTGGGGRRDRSRYGKKTSPAKDTHSLSSADGVNNQDMKKKTSEREVRTV
jgi:hypothetical protein